MSALCFQQFPVSDTSGSTYSSSVVGQGGRTAPSQASSSLSSSRSSSSGVETPVKEVQTSAAAITESGAVDYTDAALLPTASVTVQDEIGSRKVNARLMT